MPRCLVSPCGPLSSGGGNSRRRDIRRMTRTLFSVRFPSEGNRVKERERGHGDEQEKVLQRVTAGACDAAKRRYGGCRTQARNGPESMHPGRQDRDRCADSAAGRETFGVWQAAKRREMRFEGPASAGLSNSSSGAGAPAAAFGKTAFADFASVGYRDV